MSDKPVFLYAATLCVTSLIGFAAVGAATGGLIGHLARGMSRHDMKELGDLLDDGRAALIVVGHSKIGEKLDKDLARAQKSVEKQIDADSREFEKQLDEAERQLEKEPVAS